MISGSKFLRTISVGAALCFACAGVGLARSHDLPAGSAQPAQSSLSGPTFTVAGAALRKPVTVIDYGDVRFTDPSNTTSSDPTARQALVKRSAEDRHDALLLDGDIPRRGGAQLIMQFSKKRLAHGAMNICASFLSLETTNSLNAMFGNAWRTGGRLFPN